MSGTGEELLGNQDVRNAYLGALIGATGRQLQAAS